MITGTSITVQNKLFLTFWSTAWPGYESFIWCLFRLPVSLGQNWPSWSGRVVKSAELPYARQAPPMLMDVSPLMLIKKDWLPCWSSRGQQVLHERWIWGIHCTQARKHASEGSTLALKLRGNITRSPKQGYQWPHKKGLMSSKTLKKIIGTEFRITIDL